MTNTPNYSDWIGKQATAHDQVYAAKVSALAATLNTDLVVGSGQELLPLWHWIYFNPMAIMSEIGTDGHPEKGGFLPPIEYPRRMWAGGQLIFNKPLSVGEAITKTSTIKDISFKSGKSGSLAFIKLQHEIVGSQGGHILEHQDIVYREAPAAGATPAQANVVLDEEPYDWSDVITPDPVLLFRYSALTFNGHRIHYDREYSIDQEQYPGLVVQGPLTATFLMNLLCRRYPEARVKSFKFRGLRPLFDTQPFTVHGRVDGDDVRLWALTPDGQRAMDAVATIEEVS